MGQEPGVFLRERTEFSGIESNVYSQINKNIFILCERLPEPLQDPAAIFMVRYGADSFEIFRHYPPPLWTVLIGLGVQDQAEKIKTGALAAHSMALLLHSIDDHLHDGQLRVSHLLLQLRSEAWRWMLESWECFGSQSRSLIHSEIDRYFQSVLDEEHVKTLDEFLDNAGAQSATWQITPALVAPTDEKRESATAVIENFVVFYRILDDLEDAIIDLCRGEKKSVYYICDDVERLKYLGLKGSSRESSAVEEWLKMMCKNGGPFDRLMERAVSHRDRALIEAARAGWSRLEELIALSFEELSRKAFKVKES